MKAQELMTDNYVYRLGEITTVNGVHKSMNGIDYVTTLKSGTISENQISPIPIEEELLLKLGFIKSNDNILFLPIPKIQAEIHYEIHNYGNVITIQSDFGMLIPDDIINIHQLQNLYFTLTNEKLTFIE